MNWFGRRLKWPWLNRSKVLGQKLWYILQVNNLIKLNFALLSFTIVFYSITLSFYGRDIIKSNSEFNIINPFEIIEYAENDINAFGTTEIINTKIKDSENKPKMINIFIDPIAITNYNISNERKSQLLNLSRYELESDIDFFILEIADFLSGIMNYNINSKVSIIFMDRQNRKNRTLNIDYISYPDRLFNILEKEIKSFLDNSYKIIHTKFDDEIYYKKFSDEIYRKNIRDNYQLYNIIYASNELINNFDLDYSFRDLDKLNLHFIVFKNIRAKYRETISPEMISKIKTSNNRIDQLLDNSEHQNTLFFDRVMEPLRLYYNTSQKCYETQLDFSGLREGTYRLKVYSKNNSDISELDINFNHRKLNEKFNYDKNNNTHSYSFSIEGSLFKIKITNPLDNLKLSIKRENDLYEYIYDLNFYKQLPPNPALLLLSLGYIISGLSIFLVLLFITWVTLHFKYKNTLYQISTLPIVDRKVKDDTNFHLELTLINNIGQKRAELLKSNDIKTIEDFVSTNEEKLLEVLKLSKKRIAKMKESASKIMNQK